MATILCICIILDIKFVNTSFYMNHEIKLLHQHMQFVILFVLEFTLFILSFCSNSFFFLRMLGLTTDGLISRGIHKTNWFQNGYIDPYSLHKEFSAVCVFIVCTGSGKPIHKHQHTTILSIFVPNFNHIYMYTNTLDTDNEKEKFDITMRCAQ